MLQGLHQVVVAAALVALPAPSLSLVLVLASAAAQLVPLVAQLVH